MDQPATRTRWRIVTTIRYLRAYLPCSSTCPKLRQPYQALAERHSNPELFLKGEVAIANNLLDTRAWKTPRITHADQTPAIGNTAARVTDWG